MRKGIIKIKIKTMKKVIYLLLAVALMVSCENHIDITMPIGPQGNDGKSAFDIWKEYFSKLDATIEEYFDYFKGQDGLTPYIGENNNWWIGELDTNIPATGENGSDGLDGITPQIGENGNWYFGEEDTGVPAKGIDGINGNNGVTPHIGSNGNWFFGESDTGKPSKGDDGNDGSSPEIINGYWWIGGKNTGIPSAGNNGKDGVCLDCCEDYDFIVSLKSDCYGTPEDWGQSNQPGSPGWDYNPATNPRATYLVTFYVDIDGFTPNQMVKFQLYNGSHYSVVFNSSTDNNGSLKRYVSTTQAFARDALSNGIAFVNDYKIKFEHPY